MEDVRLKWFNIRDGVSITKKGNCAYCMCPAISGRGGKTALLKKKKRIVQQNKCVCIPILNK
jgi:hypothetical protein